MERLLRRRKCLRSQLDAIAQAEGLLREPQLPSSQVSISIDRINVIYAQITKINESLVNETPEDLIEADTRREKLRGKDRHVDFKASLRDAERPCVPSLAPDEEPRFYRCQVETAAARVAEIRRQSTKLASILDAVLDDSSQQRRPQRSRARI
ncbi:hypothetical protein MTO96_026599 [Rhipicephalus appendiculatus]